MPPGQWGQDRKSLLNTLSGPALQTAPAASKGSLGGGHTVSLAAQSTPVDDKVPATWPPTCDQARAEQWLKGLSINTMASIFSGNWQHIVKGHYSFSNPPAQVKPKKSYFTVPTMTLLAQLLRDTIQQAKRPVRLGIAGRIMVFYDAGREVGRSRYHVPCTMVKMVVAPMLEHNKGVIITAFPVQDVDGFPVPPSARSYPHNYLAQANNWTPQCQVVW